MTKDDAIAILQGVARYLMSGNEILYSDKLMLALDVAIDALEKVKNQNEELNNSNDLISRAVAIDAFKPYADYESNRTNADWVRRIEMVLNDLPSVQPNLQPTCNNLATDTISRQAALDDIETVDPSMILDIEWVKNWVKVLPSAQPEERTEERTETHACDLINRQAAMDANTRAVERRQYMQIDSNNLIRKLPAMIQGRRKFAKIADGGDYHIGAVDDWCLTYKEVVQAIEDYCEYIDTGKYRLSAPINGSWNVMNAYPYKESDAER